MKKLLIPVDFSASSEAAVDFGLQLAAVMGYEVMLHHALNLVEDDNRFYAISPDRTRRDLYDEDMIEKQEQKVSDYYRKWNTKNVKTSIHLTIGSLVDDIQELVKLYDVQLVVMGTKGASGLKELFVGSNAEKVVRYLHCPVIALHGHADAAKIKRILVPVDLDNLLPDFLAEMRHLHQLFEAEMEFVWVQSPHHSEPNELLVEEFEQMLKAYEVPGTFSIIRDALPHAGILNYADDVEADLIAMATHHRSGVAHLFLGSVTEDVLNHAHIPLWTFSLNRDVEPIHLVNFRKGNEAFV